MLQAANNKSEPNKKQQPNTVVSRRPSGADEAMTITRAARILRVSRTHLSRVINGHVRSRRLSQYYNDLISQQTKTKNA